MLAQSKCVANSQHITGQAADMQAPGATVLDLFKLTIELGLPFDQVIYEARSATSKWLHVSHVSPAQGSNRGEIRVAKFGPDGKAQSYPLISRQEALAMTERATRSKAQPDRKVGSSYRTPGVQISCPG